MRKILFVDRDGTLCQEPNDYIVDALEKIRLVPEVIPSLLRLKAAGYSFVIVSNQDGLGTPAFPRESFNICHDFLIELFASQAIHFEAVFFCPHYLRDNCQCRKPKAGLVESYLSDPSWDRSLSAMVGDRETDLEFATNIGVDGYRVDSPFGPGLSWPAIADRLLVREKQASSQA